MNGQSQLVARYTAQERANHWLVAIAFILAALSGLALFHPSLFFLTNLFGGGPWTRILHPFIAVVMFVSFLGLAARFWHQKRITAADRQWGANFRAMLRNRAVNLSETGKYNLGQKYIFWVLVAAIALLLASGILIWQPYFAPNFAITLVRLASLLHAVAAFVAILALIVHIYAALWVRGTVRAMTRGTVTAAWARHHHPAWYKEIMSKGEK